MMHTVKLSGLIRSRLAEMVFLQLNLLKWASMVQVVTSDTCREWLISQPSYHGHAEDIARWICSSRRIELLQCFASGPAEAKCLLSQRWREEACRFFRCQPVGNFEPFNLKNADNWQIAGANFLQSFYDSLRQTGFPAYLFHRADAKKFAAQDYFIEFKNFNGNLFICPSCDETKFSTAARGNLRFTIDHYLPRSVYPHLSIHPYNLIPVCPACNFWVKNQYDPLNGFSTRRNIEDIWLPYRDNGLSEKTYLEIRIGPNHMQAEFLEIRPKPNEEIRRYSIETLRDVYCLPERWSKCKHEIGSNLFRLMSAHIIYFLPDQEADPTTIIEIARVQLQDLVSILYEGLGREPHTFPKIWWLVKLTRDELSNKDSFFAEEIINIVHKNENAIKRHREQGGEIMQTLL